MVSAIRIIAKGSKPMPHDTPKLSQQQALAFARDLLREHLALHADGYKCTTEGLLDVLLTMAASRDTIEATCCDLARSPSAEAYRCYLREQLQGEDLDAIEDQLNRALQAALPPDVLQRLSDVAHDIACDLHDQPYYGKAEQDEGLWVRGKAKAGTTRFYRLASAYVILQGRRFTLAVRFVRPGDTTLKVLKCLLGRLRKLEIAVGLLLLDKGFCAIETMAYLSRSDYSAIIACPIRGRQGGTRALCKGRKSYRTEHTFRGGKRSFTASVIVCRSFTTAQRTGRMKRRAVWLVFVVMACRLTPRQVARRYRRRFGIETSYRLAGAVRAWTSSPNPVYRFLGLGFFLTNVWLHLRYMVAQVPRRGARYLDEALFRLGRFRRFLIRAVEAKYGCTTEIHARAAPIP
jgi:putative transposase